MPMNSRVWMYQSPRALTPDEVALMRVRLYDFCEEWVAHGTNLQCSFSIIYDRFVALLVNEEQAKASGCSIDSSTHIMKELGQKFDVDFLDRMTITYLNSEGILEDGSTADFKKFLNHQESPADIIVFNNTIGSKKELETEWEVPAKQSWQARFL